MLNIYNHLSTSHTSEAHTVDKMLNVSKHLECPIYEVSSSVKRNDGEDRKLIIVLLLHGYNACTYIQVIQTT